MPYTLKILALIISSLSLLSPQAQAQAQAQEQAESSTDTDDSDRIELLPITVVGTRDKDAEGRDKVYQENVTSVYVGREELERFQATNPGDVFKGMNGVYSMDTRSSQSITPNIRGITGEGRTPLTIDGTEQSTNVWLHFVGAGNRSYVDPALFRSIEVEKGPSLSRGIKSGVGGAVNIRTIEASDIIPEGDSWGIETNLKTSGNTSKPRFDAASVYGQDYRSVPGAERANLDGITIDTPPARTRSDSQTLNFDDHSEMLAIAGRNEFVDILLSRSERTSGNYYAGKNNANRYKGHDVWDTSTTDVYIPNLTKVYAAGSEVFNTSSETETTLIKNNWYLPNEQKLGLQFMRTDTAFGETTPGRSMLMYAYREGAEQAQPDLDWANIRNFVYEDPRSELRLDSYKLSYDIKPKDSRWLDLETSLWQTKAKGTRYQTGASPWGLDLDDAQRDELGLWDSFCTGPWEGTCTGIWPEPDHDGTIVPLGRQWTNHDRTGFDFSNQMILASNLQLTLGGSYQQEKLDERVQQSDRNTNSMLPDGVYLNAGTDRFGPRSGERKEYSAMMNLAWQATDWLTVTAGTRYLHYTGKDTGTARLRRQQSEFYKATRRKTGVELEWGELLTAEENIARLAAAAQGNEAIQQFYNGREVSFANINGYRYVFWKKTALIPYKDGKLDSSQNPFANGEVDTSKLYKVVENALEQSGNATETSVPVIYPTNSSYGTDVYETLDASQGWEAPEEQSGDAFSPVLSATARVTPYGTAFVRYAQTTRFPSVNELTSSAILDGAGTVGTLATGASKPERSINWEVGYAHDLTQFFPSLGFADMRISYYNTEIEDFIDRGLYYDSIQFDKKESSGVELQSRFDTGRVFGSLGATYRLNQKLCDKDYASGLDPYYNRIPTCMTGGFPGTYSGNSLQPKYSIDMLLGTRLFNERLELGWRSVYHAGAENSQLDSLLASESSVTSTLVRNVWFRDGNQDGFYWRSVLLHDLYANFEVNKQLALNLGVTNLTDEYYLDPMAKTLLPGPGRTLTAGLKINF
ncbi:TonB-dependent receptor domain-containing protein [Halopseudomonas pelagia]|uniref:TonB-dependent receptor domain-containing protein n=1 Tax=Halopseudomonas pelagia TaxID=553151 RepID=UPI00048BF9A1|nr:TonB-dependent receptor [Halopseudomonas pelagia]|tara:strand:- start:21814 stop:24918 length:3105 start_codon:yes stop_codon:yes gene_type:complete